MEEVVKFGWKITYYFRTKGWFQDDDDYQDVYNISTLN